MKTEKEIPVKKVTLINNCPECFSKDGLHLTFKQKFVENAYYKSVTNLISHQIDCDICKNTIYPERWSDDIERVFEYQKKAFTPRPQSTYLKRLSWILIITLVVLVFGFIITLATLLL